MAIEPNTVVFKPRRLLDILEEPKASTLNISKYYYDLFNCTTKCGKRLKIKRANINATLTN